METLFKKFVTVTFTEVYNNDRLRPLLATVDLARLDDDILGTMAKYLLTAKERHIYQAFKLRKRKLEWIGGRLAAKAIMLRLSARTTRWQDWQILPDNHGRPQSACLSTLTPQCVPLSISHSGKTAAALAVSGPFFCGIDIQVVTPTVVTVRERFCRPEELLLANNNLADYTRVKRLTLLWAAKESVRKSIYRWPLPAFNDIRFTAINNTPPTFHFHGYIKNSKQDISVRAWFEDDMAWAITCHGGNNAL